MNVWRVCVRERLLGSEPNLHILPMGGGCVDGMWSMGDMWWLICYLSCVLLRSFCGCGTLCHHWECVLIWGLFAQNNTEKMYVKTSNHIGMVLCIIERLFAVLDTEKLYGKTHVMDGSKWGLICFVFNLWRLVFQQTILGWYGSTNGRWYVCFAYWLISGLIKKRVPYITHA